MQQRLVENYEDLKNKVEVLQNTVNTLLTFFSEILYELPQINAYRYVLNSDIFTSFKGVVTFLPVHFSKDTTAASPSTELVINHSDGSSDTYTLVTVNAQGLRRNIRAGDIIANRPCQVMFLPNGYALVLNPASVFITNAEDISSVFTEDKASENLAEDLTRLDREIAELKEDVAKAIPKVIIGTGEPSEVLKDSEDNTIYFRIEEGI